jgi:hypothetical protein
MLSAIAFGLAWRASERQFSPEGLIDKEGPKRQISKLVYAIVFLIVLGSSVWVYLHFYKQSSRSGITKLESQKDMYVVGLYNDGWYDSGLWIPPGKRVYASCETCDPFIMQIGWTLQTSKLTGGSFQTGIETTSDHALLAKYSDVEYVKDQEKLWFKLSDDATHEQISITVQIK